MSLWKWIFKYPVPIFVGLAFILDAKNFLRDELVRIFNDGGELKWLAKQLGAVRRVLLRKSKVADRTSRFFGRGLELKECKRKLLRLKYEVLQVHGPSGLGKTRLAREFQSYLQYFTNTWWVRIPDIKPPANLDELVALLVRELHIKPEPNRTDLDVVSEFLKRDVGILFLDNCEASIQSITDFFKNIEITRCRVRFFITSIRPLPLPVVLGDNINLKALAKNASFPGKDPGVKLFIERVSKKRSAPFDPTLAEKREIQEICYECAGGKPLHIIQFAAGFDCGNLADYRRVCSTATSKLDLPDDYEERYDKPLYWIVERNLKLISEPAQTLFWLMLATFRGPTPRSAVERCCDSVMDVASRLDELERWGLIELQSEHYYFIPQLRLAALAAQSQAIESLPPTTRQEVSRAEVDSLARHALYYTELLNDTMKPISENRYLETLRQVLTIHGENIERARQTLRQASEWKELGRLECASAVVSWMAGNVGGTRERLVRLLTKCEHCDAAIKSKISVAMAMIMHLEGDHAGSWQIIARVSADQLLDEDWKKIYFYFLGLGYHHGANSKAAIEAARADPK